MSAAGTVHVACGESAALLAAAPPPERWLSASESRRLQALQSARRRESFLAVRWQARWLLAQAFGGDPASWPLDAPNDAPPRVVQRSDLLLSVSHSDGLVATALGSRAIGIDLEVPRPGRDIAGLRALCCTASEQALFDGLDADRCAALFHELWTVKEAWLKRRGDWLAPSRLQQIEVAPDNHGDIGTWSGPQLHLALCIEGSPQVRWWSRAPGDARRWSVRVDRAGATPA
jgi:4'-phosphopantetheinyl transferase